MKAVVCLLCDGATVREGLLHILGGGINRLGRPALPSALGVDLALMLEPDNVDELPGQHIIKVRVNSDAGDQLLFAQIDFMIGGIGFNIDPPPSFPMAIPLRNVMVSAYGYYVLQVTCDDKPIANLRFIVEKQLLAGTTQQAVVTPPHSFDA